MAQQMKVPIVDLGAPNSAPQWKFFESTTRFTAYGGARGGGKTWAARTKAVLGAMNYAGIRILFVRREYDDLESTIITPILSAIPEYFRAYNKNEHKLSLGNGSIIKFGNMPGYGSAVGGKYQGQEYDWLFIEEATQFTENEFRGLCAIVRGTSAIPKRIYLTCNPGGIGHFWVKRLFIDRAFRRGEKASDYTFIPATVDDNKDLMDSDPDYVHMLELLPEDIRNAHRYGDWDALSGVFFTEFQEGKHTCKPFPLPAHWKRYRAMDYGLDMFACLWFAVNEQGRCYVYRQFGQSDMIVSEAARKQLDLTRPEEDIHFTVAPPDMWARNRENGKSQASLFAENGVGLLRADNNRVAGWAAVKELLKVQADGLPNLIIFDTCSTLIDCLKCLMHDQTNPNDVAKQPHDITHFPDALRYFCQTYLLPAEVQREEAEEEDTASHLVDYHTAMCGGAITQSYLLS